MEITFTARKADYTLHKDHFQQKNQHIPCKIQNKTCANFSQRH